MARSKQKKRRKAKNIGGLPFFLTLTCLIYLSISNSLFLSRMFSPAYIDNQMLRNWSQFLMGGVIGAFLSHVFIRGHFSVLIHEFKHSIISQLAGNKAKGMKVRRESGHFKYQYTRESEKFNSLIALAPYFLPLFTFVGFLIALALYASTDIVVLLIIGIAYGGDCLLNLRDVSPIQTDLTNITGGYKVGVLFVAAMNVAIFTMLAAWVSHGMFGLKVLFVGHFDFMVHIVDYYRSL